MQGTVSLFNSVICCSRKIIRKAWLDEVSEVNRGTLGTPTPVGAVSNRTRALYEMTPFIFFIYAEEER